MTVKFNEALRHVDPGAVRFRAVCFTCPKTLDEKGQLIRVYLAGFHENRTLDEVLAAAYEHDAQFAGQHLIEVRPHPANTWPD